MKSQSSTIPRITQYTDDTVAVPINMIEHQTEDTGVVYEFDLYLVERRDGGDIESNTREYLKQAVKQHHDELIDQGCPTSFGFRVDCKSQNVVDWSAALQLLQLSGAPTIDICDFDNTTHTLTAAQFTQMCGEIGMYLAGLRSTKWRIREAIDAAETEADAYAAAKWD